MPVPIPSDGQVVRSGKGDVREKHTLCGAGCAHSAWCIGQEVAWVSRERVLVSRCSPSRRRVKTRWRCG